MTDEQRLEVSRLVGEKSFILIVLPPAGGGAMEVVHSNDLSESFVNWTLIHLTGAVPGSEVLR